MLLQVAFPSVMSGMLPRAVAVTGVAAVAPAPAAVAAAPSICGSSPSVKALVAAVAAPHWREAFFEVDSDTDASATVLFATNVTAAAFDAFVKAAERFHVSMRFEGGCIFIYELPLARHEVPSMTLLELGGRFQFAQAQRRAPPSLSEFNFEGSTLFSLGPGSGRRAADQTMRPHGNTNVFPPVIIEVGASETIAELDWDAQFWLGDPRTQGQVQAVITVKVFQRRPHPTPPGAVPGHFAAVASLYLRGQGGEGVGRVVNPDIPAPVIPVFAVSFGSAHVAVGALCAAQGLGLALSGYVAGPGGVAACTAIGMPAYQLVVPATHLYTGVPAALLPAGYPGGGNDWAVDLFELVHALNTTPSFRDGM